MGSFLAVLLSLLALALVHADIPAPTILFFNQTLDHFNFMNSQTFLQRYFVVDTFYKKGGPCFFYTGNEGALEEFYYNTGFPFDNAPSFGALVVFAEHRFYGGSRPFGDTPTAQQFGLLSVEQALADYAVLVESLKAQYGVLPLISIGGSYGGMLSAWFRIKYPHLVDMALAASAPLAMVSQLTPPPAFFAAVTNTFAAANAACPAAMRRAFADVAQTAASGAAGLATLTSAFRLCRPLTAADVNHLVLWVVNSFVSLAMCDYPYPASFLAPLPAFPVRAACALLQNASSSLEGLAASAGLFYNGTGGTLPCFDIYSEFIECADATGCGTGPDGTAWDYQACSEINYAPTTNNVSDMFPPRAWDLERLAAYCVQAHGVKPRPQWLETAFGGSSIGRSASRIIFSNGLLDPWHAGGFLQSLSPDLPAVIIKDGAHHLDLRSANPQDPQSVIDARRSEVQFLKQWLADL